MHYNNTYHLGYNLLFQAKDDAIRILCRPLHNRTITTSSYRLNHHHYFFLFFPFLCCLYSISLARLFLIFGFSHLLRSEEVQLRGVFIYVMGLLAEYYQANIYDFKTNNSTNNIYFNSQRSRCLMYPQCIFHLIACKLICVSLCVSKFLFLIEFELFLPHFGIS